MKTRSSRAASLLTAAWLIAAVGAAWLGESAAAPAGPVPQGQAGAPAIELLRERAAGGNAEAQYDLGVAMLCRRGLARDPRDAARLLSRAAEQGHVGAQSVLGWILMTGGRGLRRDAALAAGWLQRAAAAGDTAAQNNLGALYATGQGLARDDAAAERWFQAAADQGAEMAAQNLAVLRSGGARRTAQPHKPGALHPALAAAGCGAAAASS